MKDNEPDDIWCRHAWLRSTPPTSGQAGNDSEEVPLAKDRTQRASLNSRLSHEADLGHLGGAVRCRRL